MPLPHTHPMDPMASLEEDKGDGGCLRLPEEKAKGEVLRQDSNSKTAEPKDGDPGDTRNLEGLGLGAGSLPGCPSRSVRRAATLLSWPGRRGRRGAGLAAPAQPGGGRRRRRRRRRRW